MSDTSNVELIRQLFGAVEEGNLDFIVEHVAPNAVRHDLVGAYPDVGGDNVGDFISLIRAGVPDIRLNIQDIFGCGDRVTVRFILEGTHAGDLFGVAGSGEQISVNAINIYRLENGRMRETWQLQDLAGFLSQIRRS